MSRPKKDVQPYWRPDFRIPASLPDIKVVRTDFIINFIVITILVIVAAFVLQREYRAFAMRGTIDDLERRIRIADSDDSLYLKQNGRFLDASRNVIELESFYFAPFLPHHFMAELIELRPKDLIFKSLEYSESVKKEGTKSAMEYSVLISGEVQSLGALTEFKRVLQAAELLKVDGYETEVIESDGGRDAKTGIFPCRIDITIKPKKAAAKKEDAS